MVMVFYIKYTELVKAVPHTINL